MKRFACVVIGLLFLLTLTACKEEIPFNEVELLCVDFDKQALKQGIVINTQEEYESFFSMIPEEFCEEYPLPEIDFDTRTLLGFYRTGGGCSVDFRREVYRDGEGIVYSVKTKSRGVCDMIKMSPNLVTIPKTTEPVEFRRG